MTAFFVQSRPENTAVKLCRAFAEGQEVSLLDMRTKRWLDGRIQGIRVESGYSGGDRPTMFLVDLATEKCGFVSDIYVKTV